jgi:hypothetical protein
VTLLGQIATALAGVFLLLSITLGFGVYHYRNEALDLARDLVVAGVNKATCEAGIKAQNEAVEALALDYEARIASFKPVTRTEYRDRTVVRYVDRNITTEECHETASAIATVRALHP